MRSMAWHRGAQSTDIGDLSADSRDLRPFTADDRAVGHQIWAIKGALKRGWQLCELSECRESHKGWKRSFDLCSRQGTESRSEDHWQHMVFSAPSICNLFFNWNIDRGVVAEGLKGCCHLEFMDSHGINTKN